MLMRYSLENNISAEEVDTAMLSDNVIKAVKKLGPIIEGVKIVFADERVLPLEMVPANTIYCSLTRARSSYIQGPRHECCGSFSMALSCVLMKDFAQLVYAWTHLYPPNPVKLNVRLLMLSRQGLLHTK